MKSGSGLPRDWSGICVYAFVWKRKWHWTLIFTPNTTVFFSVRPWKPWSAKKMKKLGKVRSAHYYHTELSNDTTAHIAQHIQLLIYVREFNQKMVITNFTFFHRIQTFCNSICLEISTWYQGLLPVWSWVIIVLSKTQCRLGAFHIYW